MQNELKFLGALDGLLEKTSSIEQTAFHTNKLAFSDHFTIKTIKDLMLQQQNRDLHAAHPNPLARFGRKCFSQTDEDGITMEIVRRLGIEQGVYAEFGAGDGLENNTLILAAMGWYGFWVGCEDLVVDISKATKFAYIKDWITMENITNHALLGLDCFVGKPIDVASLDLDGNDIYFVEKLLTDNFQPKLFIVEYNAKFPPPVKFQIAYDPKNTWKVDDYFGASISSYVELFERFGYTLICCNAASGANAFFIANEYLHLFTDVPRDISKIYVEPSYHLYTTYGHPTAAKTIESFLNI